MIIGMQIKHNQWYVDNAEVKSPQDINDYLTCVWCLDPIGPTQPAISCEATQG